MYPSPLAKKKNANLKKKKEKTELLPTAKKERKG